ncbi:MAG TPA: MBL fold metallo-hydrolase [Candidatus Angelobacter sp.]|nr:MBL fold metallo-hydrolase [Candidatus Angelobacter sp.]
MPEVYLRRDVQMEPLFDRWYAWSYLIPPATAARNITERHLKIIDSYLAAPQVHANAAKNPKLLGGPFIDYGGKRVDEIRELRAQTMQKRASLLELSVAIAELDDMLRKKAKGHCLEGLYQTVPKPLRGYVELVYDLNNQPSLRLLEALLYRSEFYDRDAQSLSLSLTAEDDRPFVLSTPRLRSPEFLDVSWSFDDERIDVLARSKSSPIEAGVALDLLRGESGNELARSFFTATPPRPYEPYCGRGVRWRYFGHACILVETPRFSMLFDPVISYSYHSDIPRYTYEDLPDKIDFVLITHNHQDHVLFETLLQLRHKVGTFVVPKSRGGTLQDPSLRLILEHTGCKNVMEIGDLESIPLDDGEITAIPFLGEHADLSIETKSAYLIRKGKHKLLFAADSCNIEPELYNHLFKIIGGVDVLFLGMECDGAPLTWLYGPLLTQKIERGMDESRRLAGSNYERAKQLVDSLGAKEVYVYAMGQEPWLNHIMSIKYTEQSRPIVDSNRLIQEHISKGLCAERLFGEKEILIECEAEDYSRSIANLQHSSL